jgi:hypothetical protein
LRIKTGKIRTKKSRKRMILFPWNLIIGFRQPEHGLIKKKKL